MRKDDIGTCDVPNSGQDEESGLEQKLREAGIKARYFEFMRRYLILKKRNRTLSRLVYFHAWIKGLMTDDMPFSLEDMRNRRGRKLKRDTFPAKLIMNALGISRRQAETYQMALRLMDDLDEMNAVGGHR